MPSMKYSRKSLFCDTRRNIVMLVMGVEINCENKWKAKNERQGKIWFLVNTPQKYTITPTRLHTRNIPPPKKVEKISCFLGCLLLIL